MKICMSVQFCAKFSDLFLEYSLSRLNLFTSNNYNFIHIYPVIINPLLNIIFLNNSTIMVDLDVLHHISPFIPVGRLSSSIHHFFRPQLNAISSIFHLVYLSVFALPLAHGSQRSGESGCEENQTEGHILCNCTLLVEFKGNVLANYRRNKDKTEELMETEKSRTTLEAMLFFVLS